MDRGLEEPRSGSARLEVAHATHSRSELPQVAQDDVASQLLGEAQRGGGLLAGCEGPREELLVIDLDRPVVGDLADVGAGQAQELVRLEQANCLAEGRGEGCALEGVERLERMAGGGRGSWPDLDTRPGGDSL